MQTIPTEGPEIPVAVRTDDARFEGLPDFPFPPHYVDVANPYASETPLRMHYVDEGPRDGPVVLMLHGEPAWSFLYRKLIPVFVEAGLRAVAIDQIGFGRSDKPTRPSHYSFANHIEWVRQLVERLEVVFFALCPLVFTSVRGGRCAGRSTILRVGGGTPSHARVFRRETRKFLGTKQARLIPSEAHVGLVKRWTRSALLPDCRVGPVGRGDGAADRPRAGAGAGRATQHTSIG